MREWMLMATVCPKGNTYFFLSTLATLSHNKTEMKNQDLSLVNCASAILSINLTMWTIFHANFGSGRAWAQTLNCPYNSLLKAATLVGLGPSCTCRRAITVTISSYHPSFVDSMIRGRIFPSGSNNNCILDSQQPTFPHLAIRIESFMHAPINLTRLMQHIWEKYSLLFLLSIPPSLI